MNDNRHYICIDIGGTTIKYGLIAENSRFSGNNSTGRSTEKTARPRVQESQKMPTESVKGGTEILKKVCQIVERYKDGAIGVCISSAGMIDIDNGSVFYAGPTIPNYAGTQFKKTIEERFSIPCEVENDVNCAGLAEATSGAAQGCESVLCMTAGTGIGGCFVLNGKVYHGFSGSACEIGYMQVDGRDFQDLGATSVMTGTVRENKKKAGDLSYWGGRRIFSEARKGDPVCAGSIARMVDTLGKGIANICYVLNPEIVVLGGGIMMQEEYLYPRIREALDYHLKDVIASRTTLKFASYRNEAGMVGAYYHFLQMQKKRKSF